MKIKTFRDLLVWRVSHKFTLEIYKATNTFPKDERFGIISQIRRASLSSTTNIAEGSKRKSRKDFAHFINISEASLEESKYLLIVSRDLEYLNKTTFIKLFNLSNQIGSMLSNLRKALR